MLEAAFFYCMDLAESSEENAKKKRAVSETSCSVDNMATNNSLHSSENPILQGQAVRNIV